MLRGMNLQTRLSVFSAAREVVQDLVRNGDPTSANAESKFYDLLRRQCPIHLYSVKHIIEIYGEVARFEMKKTAATAGAVRGVRKGLVSVAVDFLAISEKLVLGVNDDLLEALALVPDWPWISSDAMAFSPGDLFDSITQLPAQVQMSEWDFSLQALVDDFLPPSHLFKMLFQSNEELGFLDRWRSEMGEPQYAVLVWGLVQEFDARNVQEPASAEELRLAFAVYVPFILLELPQLKLRLQLVGY